MGWIPTDKKDAKKHDGDTARFVPNCPGCGREAVFVYQSKGGRCGYCS